MEDGTALREEVEVKASPVAQAQQPGGSASGQGQAASKIGGTSVDFSGGALGGIATRGGDLAAVIGAVLGWAL